MRPSDKTDWLVAAQAALRSAALGPRVEHRGQVEEIGDGIAMISGLRDVRLDEVMHFQGGQVGFARVLDSDQIGCVLLDAATDVEAGDAVFGTGEVVNVPVGEALLGRIVDPLGRPLDGKGPIQAASRLPIERPAPSIIERDLVTEPVQTGIVAMDTLFALGRGQRELIVGDHSTGKTTLAIDALIAQRDTDMICIYVAVGQKTSSVRRAIDALQAQGNFERCIVLVASSASAPGLQWIAPYAGMTMAEYFRDKGQHALIVIDDLSKHAATHREIALLTRQSPGREAYPGDVFYIHARLLERAAKLSKDRGGGSLTALPIAETDSGNLSAYIPTNLISITDGQIVLDAALFHQGQKPAVDVGLSVSRVGGKTQAPSLRTAAGTLRLDYAQFLELEVFTRFGGMPEGRVRDQLKRGERIRAILRQPQHAPFRLADEVGLMLAVQSGLLDPLPLDAVAAFRAGLPAALERDAAEVLSTITASGEMEAETRKVVMTAITRLAQSLSSSNADVSTTGDDVAEPPAETPAS
ncbi:F0F1 ATP synthase subunit alpha [Hoeflea sp. AS60]|uniref:F0F1 ATP synthase subunit alpha n=1 Tax=Hoeflea sp. AS60 TaxID=3135780 RepID=UPI00316E6C38